MLIYYFFYKRQKNVHNVMIYLLLFVKGTQTLTTVFCRPNCKAPFMLEIYFVICEIGL